MITSALVTDIHPRRDGKWGLKVRLESGSDRELKSVVSDHPVEVGRRVRVTGAGSLWEIVTREKAG